MIYGTPSLANPNLPPSESSAKYRKAGDANLQDSRAGLSLSARVSLFDSARERTAPESKVARRAQLCAFTLGAGVTPAARRAGDYSPTPSLAAPHRLALFQECADSFLRVHRHRVLAHHFFRVVVGLRRIQIDLLVECPLA